MLPVVKDCILLLLLFSVLHLTIIPFLCSNLAFSVYFRGSGTSEYPAEQDGLLDLFEEEREEKEESSMRIVILTAEREGGVSYRQRTILSVLREMSLARETYHQLFVCSADRGDLADIPRTNTIALLQPCKHHGTEGTGHQVTG